MGLKAVQLLQQAGKTVSKYTDDVVNLSYCTGSGLIATETCSSTAYGWYKKSNIPAKCNGCGTDADEEESTTKPGTTEKPDTTQKPGTSEPSSSKPNEGTTLPIPPIVVPEIPSEVVSALQEIPRPN